MKNTLHIQKSHSSTSKKGLRKLILTCLLLFSFATDYAQSADKLFGLNYWLYQKLADGTVQDNMATNLTELKSWSPDIVRIGGNGPNNGFYGMDKTWYVAAIKNAKTMGAIPLVQLPIHLTTAQVSEFVYYINTTQGLGVTYWSIGNEPDPSDNNTSDGAIKDWDKWYAGTLTEDGFTFATWKTKYKSLVTKLRQIAPSAVICGPDFRHWWGTTTTGAFGTWYKSFLADVGVATTTTTSGTKPLLDIFAFHYYSDGLESDYAAKFTTLNSLIATTNTSRTSNGVTALKIATGEFNATSNGTTFSAGQNMIAMAKQNLKNGAVYMCPWSPQEGNGFSMMTSGGDLYSTAEHWKLVSTLKKGNYMTGQISDSKGGYIMEFGMQDANGYTIVLMNKSSTDYKIAVNFSTTVNTYNTATADVKFRFNSNQPTAAFSGVTLYKNSTIVYTYNASGLRLNKYEYRSGWGAPVMSVVNAVANVAAPKTAAVSETLNNELKLYPNPVSDVLNVDVPSSNSSTLEIYAIDGKKVYTKSVNGTNTTQVDVSKFSKGMYILKLLSTESEEIISKFIVK